MKNATTARDLAERIMHHLHNDCDGIKDPTILAPDDPKPGEQFASHQDYVAHETDGLEQFLSAAEPPDGDLTADKLSQLVMEYLAGTKKAIYNPLMWGNTADYPSFEAYVESLRASLRDEMVEQALAAAPTA